MKKCLGKYLEIVDSQEYQGQEIHLDVGVGIPYNTFNYAFSYEEGGASGTQPNSRVAGSITSTNGIAKSHNFFLHSIDCFPSRIFVSVKISRFLNIKLKVDKGVDRFAITTADLLISTFSL